MPSILTTTRRTLLRRSAAPRVLSRAVAYALARNYSGSGAWLDESGRGHNAQLGSTSGADANDPLFLTTESGLPYLYLPGTVSNYASVPDAAALDITGDIDLRFAGALSDWTPSSSMDLVAKFLAPGSQRSYILRLQVNGRISIVWSPDGSSGAALSVTSNIAPTVTDGALLLIRATLDVDNGASGYTGRFYTKTSTWATVFADLRAHTGWTQLDADVTAGASATSIFSGTAPLEIGAVSSAPHKLAAVAVYNGIAGTEVFAHNFTDLAAYNATRTSATAATGQTVTINRSAADRKSCVVDQPLFLFGPDDYMIVADHDDMDFTETESFTVAAVVRTYGSAANETIVAKSTGTPTSTSAGYIIAFGPSQEPRFGIGDSTNNANDIGVAISNGVVTMAAGRRNVAADVVEAFKNGTGSGSPTTDATTATLANAQDLRLGAQSDSGGPANTEIMAWALFREALSDADLARLATELGA